MGDSADEDAPGEERTVFIPATGPASTAPEPVEPPAADPADSWAKTVPPAPPAPAFAPEPPAWTPPPPPRAAGRIAVGSLLNNIYEVRRFIARGGMGEVYEGVNTHTDERVAIKVMLSHLADDPNVQAMFRREARTLTRLSHPALVQYRVLAQEPSLHAFYIVTEYIDGSQLAEVIGQITPTAEELEQLTRRLAAGLAAAHELGAIHRDMSPDNVLLPEGRLSQAKIIDFGIAKDLDPSNKTIVGDGFAGKLGFVAPEQFGDYDREVGPWTDVYSLALVILSVAAGKTIDMGATLVDAIDKRRSGPDLAAIPDRLRPVLAKMLAPNPAERYRSMAEVLEALDGQVPGSGAAQPASTRSSPPPAGRSAKPGSKPPGKGPPLGLILGGAGLAVVLVAVVVGVILMTSNKTSQAPPPVVADASQRGSEQVRRAVEAALPGVACTWIDVDQVSDGPAGVSLRLSGVAGQPSQAQQALTKAAEATGQRIDLVDASNVFPVGPQTCAPLDTFRALRRPTSELGRDFVSEQANWEMQDVNDPCPGSPNAKAVVNIKVPAGSDFSLVGMEGTGQLQQLFKDRAATEAFAKDFPAFMTPTGADQYRSTVCNNRTGLVGQLLVTGQKPFDLALPDAQTTNEGKLVDAAWLQRFSDTARARGWKTEMVWYRVVNDTPG
jgi:serine/threonine-protein kinase